MRALVDREPDPWVNVLGCRTRRERGEQRTMDLSAGARPHLCRLGEKPRISDAGGGPTSRGHS